MFTKKNEGNGQKHSWKRLSQDEDYHSKTSFFGIRWHDINQVLTKNPQVLIIHILFEQSVRVS